MLAQQAECAESAAAQTQLKFTVPSPSDWLTPFVAEQQRVFVSR